MSYEGTSKVKSVNIHHPFLRSCIYTVELQNRLYPTPYPCSVCGVDHIFKTFHFNLNQHGDVVVSEAVYEAMKMNSQVEDLKATRVATPTMTTINLAVSPHVGQYTVVSREHGSNGVPIVIAGKE